MFLQSGHYAADNLRTDQRAGSVVYEQIGVRVRNGLHCGEGRIVAFRSSWHNVRHFFPSVPRRHFGQLGEVVGMGDYDDIVDVRVSVERIYAALEYRAASQFEQLFRLFASHAPSASSGENRGYVPA